MSFEKSLSEQNDDMMAQLEQTLIDFRFWVHCIEAGKRDALEEQTTVIVSDDDRTLLRNAKHELEQFIEQAKRDRYPHVRPINPRSPFGQEYDPEDTRS